MRLAFARAWGLRALVLSLALIACERKAPLRASSSPDAAIDSTAENKLFDGTDPASLDLAVAPCDDFYAYACGGWTAKTTIPEDEGIFFRTFSTQKRAAEEVARAILEHDATGPSAEIGSEELGDFYAACEDTAAIDARGDGDLRGLLDRVVVKTPDGLAEAMASLHLLGIPALFSLEPELDPADATKTIAVVRQPPLTISEDEYSDAKEMGEVRAHAARLFALAGDLPQRAEAEARDAVGVEAVLAGGFESRLLFHDPAHALRVTSASSMSQIQPNFRWKRYFATMGLGPQIAVHVATEAYLRRLATLLANAADPRWVAYLRWNLLRALAPYATAAYRAEDFQFARRTSGAVSPPERWRTCVRAAESLMGDELFDAFASSVSTPPDHDRGRAIANSLLEQRRWSLGAEAWSSVDNRKRAQRKIERVQIQIRDASRAQPPPSPTLDRRAYFSDVLSALQRARLRDLARIGGPASERPIDASSFAPNASFDPRRNRIDLSVALLRSPLLGPPSVATDLGSLGTIVGHEITHAIDRTGWRFDESGNFDALAALHEEHALQFLAPFVGADLDATSIGGMTLRRSAIIEEAMADVNGLDLAYRALVRQTSESADPAKRDRAFFTAYAQVWCAKMRPEALQTFVKEDPHPPPSVRVDETVPYMGEFGAAFNCGKDSPMMRPPLEALRY